MSPPGWYPDPGRRHEHRYWDGQRWTDDVADRGVAGRDPLAPPAPPHPPRPGGGTVFTEPLLVIDRRFVMDGYDTYAATIADAAGRPLATLEEPRAGSFGSRVMERFASDVNPAQLRHYQVVDPRGEVLFTGDRPASDLFGQPYAVRDPHRAEIGRLVPRGGPGNRVEMQTPRGTAGWVVRQPLLTVLDGAGAELARMTQMPQRGGAWGEIDNRYVIHVDRPLEGSIGSLLVAALLYLEP